MPSYRGIEQADIVKSINDAIALIETHSPGAECQKNIDALRAIDPATNQSKLGAVTAAADDKSFIEAVGQLRGTLMFLEPVFRFHGINDTDGTGLNTYKQLSSWGALSGARDMAYHAEDGEMDSYLAAEYARKLAEKLPVVTGLKNIFWSVATGGRDGLGASRKLNSLVRQARRGASDDALKQAFLALDIRDRHLVKDAASAACHMHYGQKTGLPEEESMSRFGLVIPELGKSLNWGSPEVKAQAEQVHKVLEPFWASDEVDMTGVGLVRMDKDSPQGVIFGGTRRAAAAVAAAFPDMQVIDYKGNIVAPPAAPAAPQAAAPKAP